MGADFDKHVDDYKEQIDKYARIAGGSYDYFARFRLGLMMERIARRVPYRAPGTILDFGCGVGATAVHMRDQFPDSAIVGIDTSPKSIEAARRLPLDRARFIALESSELPFGGDSFEAIYSNGTLHHIPRPMHGKVLRELFRVCAPGGDVCIFENNAGNPMMACAMRKNPLDEGIEPVSPGYLKRLMASAGFTVEGRAYYAFFPKGFTFLRWAEKYLSLLPFGAQYLVWATKP
jgi:ubiquinone/menaquinone biosynthesis C-methylase UbiE